LGQNASAALPDLRAVQIPRIEVFFSPRTQLEKSVVNCHQPKRLFTACCTAQSARHTKPLDIFLFDYAPIEKLAVQCQSSTVGPSVFDTCCTARFGSCCLAVLVEHDVMAIIIC
jgi:hypothetical protein